MEQVIAQKDKEIAEFQLLLDSKRSNFEKHHKKRVQEMKFKATEDVEKLNQEIQVENFITSIDTFSWKGSNLVCRN